MRHRNDTMDDLRGLDPIDSEYISAAWSSSDAKSDLLEEITSMPLHAHSAVDGVRRHSVPKRTLVFAAGIAAATAAIVLVQGILFNSSPAFGVRQMPNGVIEIDASTQLRDGDALAAELREYGVDVEVVAVPSSPSAVGQVEVFPPGGGDYVPEGISFGADGSAEVFELTIDPAVFTEQLTVELHVTADDAEPYTIAEEVFEPGEVLGGLHCALGVPLRAEDLAPYLADVEVDPVWFVISPTDDSSITSEVQVDEAPDGQVLWGYARDAKTVQLTVLPDGVKLSEAHSPRLSDVPCTAEQAAAWN